MISKWQISGSYIWAQGPLQLSEEGLAVDSRTFLALCMNAFFFSKADFLFVSSALGRQGPSVSRFFKYLPALVGYHCQTWAMPPDSLTFLCAVLRDGVASGMHPNHGLCITKGARMPWGLISSQILPMFWTKINKMNACVLFTDIAASLKQSG